PRGCLFSIETRFQTSRLRTTYLRNNLSSLIKDLIQVLFAHKTFGVQFVDVFCARGPGGNPTVPGHHLQPANLRVVYGRRSQLQPYSLTRKLVCSYSGRRQHLQRKLELRTSRSIYAPIVRRSKEGSEALVVLTRVATGARQNLCRQKRHNYPVFLGSPRFAVLARKLAPALSSPPKQIEQLSNPLTNHLNPTGTSYNLRPS